MAKRSIPCPKCGSAIAVPEEPGDFLVCGGCRAKLKVAGGRPRNPAPVERENVWDDMDEAVTDRPPMARAARSESEGGQPIVIILAIAAVLALVVGGAATAWYLMRPEDPQVGQKKDKEQEPPKFNLDSKNSTPQVDERVARAVEKGKHYLRTQVLTQDPKNIKNSPRPGAKDLYQDYYPAVFALMGLALLESGLPPDDEAIQRVAKIVREDTQQEREIYVLSTCLFFLNRLNRDSPRSPEDQKLTRTLALRIIAGQWPSGVWHYKGKLLTADEEAKMLTALKDGTHKPLPRFSDGKEIEVTGPPVGYSMSNSQFAILALWGSRNSDLHVEVPLMLFAEHCHNYQVDDGHWRYQGREEYYETMSSTCAGLIGLAMEKALLKDDNKDIARQAKQLVKHKKNANDDAGFAYVARSIGRKMGDPGGAQFKREKGTLFGADAYGDLYFLWCVERLGMIYNKDKFDGKDWYAWGKPIILDAQARRSDGSWSDKHGPLVDTSFALLFLQRANIAKDLAAKLRSLMQAMLLPQRGRPERTA